MNLLKMLNDVYSFFLRRLLLDLLLDLLGLLGALSLLLLLSPFLAVFLVVVTVFWHFGPRCYSQEFIIEMIWVSQ